MKLLNSFNLYLLITTMGAINSAYSASAFRAFGKKYTTWFASNSYLAARLRNTGACFRKTANLMRENEVPKHLGIAGCIYGAGMTAKYAEVNDAMITDRSPYNHDEQKVASKKFMRGLALTSGSLLLLYPEMVLPAAYVAGGIGAIIAAKNTVHHFVTKHITEENRCRSDFDDWR